MGRKKSLSPTKRAKIVTLFNDAKLSKKAIARRENIDPKTVHRCLVKFESTGSYRDAPRSGRPAKLTIRDKRKLIRILEIDRRRSSAQLRDDLAIGGGTSVNSSTIRRFLLRMGFRGRVAVRKPFISEVNRKKRVEFAESHLNWTEADWSRVLWSDESKFEYFNQRTRIHVRRRPGERYKLKCMVGTVKHGGGFVLVWGSFGTAGVGDLVYIPNDPKFTALAYVDLLENHLEASTEAAIPLRSFSDWIWTWIGLDKKAQGRLNFCT